MWFPLQRADLGFIASAPFRFDTVATLPAPPERVFEAFAEPSGLARFVDGYRGCEWTTRPPHGVGSRRELRLSGLSFREHFLAWEPGRRMCFAIDALTLPLMRRMVEDVQLEPLERGRTRLIWSVHYDPAAVARLAHALVRFGAEARYRRSAERLNEIKNEIEPEERSPYDGRIHARG